MKRLIVLTLLLAGCQASRPAVSHVVLCWLKEPGNAEARERLVATSKSFRSLPGVLDVRVGEPIPSPRPVVDSSFDVGVVIRFKDQAAMDAYEKSPAHQQAVKDVLGPLSKRLQIYDIAER